MLAKAASTNSETAIVSFGVRIAAVIKKRRICVLQKMGLGRPSQILAVLSRIHASTSYSFESGKKLVDDRRQFGRSTSPFIQSKSTGMLVIG